MQATKILIADDDRDMRTALRLRLEQQGYAVDECADGLGACARSRAATYDAIILDHNMPLGEGRDIAVRLRGHTPAPIIFISGSSPEDFREIVMSLPETYFVRKPFDEQKLAELLESVLPSGAASGR